MMNAQTNSSLVRITKTAQTRRIALALLFVVSLSV
jgi:hypothetical protein